MNGSSAGNALPPRCESTYIQVHTGRKFWPANPDPADLDIRDIAHALALMNRYNGHTKRPLSVAQHSVLCSLRCPDEPRWALLHDATEAYLPDVTRPVKRLLPQFDDIETRLMRVIADRYGLVWPMPECVKHIDTVMLVTERRDVLATPPIPWAGGAGIDPLPERIVPWPWEEAERAFLLRFAELFPWERS
jgi:uncharacterized protein